jgi:hypothetical protein
MMFGEDALPRAEVQKSAEQSNLLHCSFCGKNQHEVRKLVAGPAVYICDACVDLCTDIVDDQLLRLIEGDEGSARAMSTDRLLHYVEHAHRGVERCRSARYEQALRTATPIISERTQ